MTHHPFLSRHLSPNHPTTPQECHNLRTTHLLVLQYLPVLLAQREKVQPYFLPRSTLLHLIRRPPICRILPAASAFPLTAKLYQVFQNRISKPQHRTIWNSCRSNLQLSENTQTPQLCRSLLDSQPLLNIQGAVNLGKVAEEANRTLVSGLWEEKVHTGQRKMFMVEMKVGDSSVGSLSADLYEYKT